jgi:hypothetical protein
MIDSWHYIDAESDTKDNSFLTFTILTNKEKKY